MAVSAMTALLCLGLVGVASARQPTSRKQVTAPPVFAVKGSDGFAVKVTGIANYLGDEEKVFVSARKGMRETTSISTRGR